MAKTKKSPKVKKPQKKDQEVLELEPCPFLCCRGKAKLIENPWGKYIQCVCGACSPQFDVDTSNKIVAESWNKR